MGEVKEKVGSDRSILRIMVGGYLIYLAVKLFKGALTAAGSKIAFIVFSVIFATSGILCIARSVYSMMHNRAR